MRLLLFVIYTNDLPKITDKDAKVVLYADDTSITVTNCNQQTTLNKTLCYNLKPIAYCSTLINHIIKNSELQTALTLRSILTAFINMLLTLHIQIFWV